MSEQKSKIQAKDAIQIVAIVLLLTVTVFADFIEIAYVKDEYRNGLLGKIVQQGSGAAAVLLLMRRLHIRLTGKVQNYLYLLPCLVIAIDNFQWSSFLSGKMQLVRTQPWDFILFFFYCLTVGLFEESIFRGLLFSVMAGYFSKDKKGFLKTFAVSSVVFGLAHLFNGLSVGTLLQVGYSTLTGGLFAFCLIKTKNVLCCALVHGLYNFCGLLFNNVQGLGGGVVFDMGTVITMLIVSVAVGAFVLYKTWTYSEAERVDLYEKLGV